MQDEPRQLMPLEPSGDQLGRERLVQRILAGAAPELNRRQLQSNPLLLLTTWARPTLAAAGLAALLAGSSFFLAQRLPTPENEAVATGLGMPISVEEWLTTGEAPPIDELVYALE